MNAFDILAHIETVPVYKDRMILINAHKHASEVHACFALSLAFDAYRDMHRSAPSAIWASPEALLCAATLILEYKA